MVTVSRIAAAVDEPHAHLHPLAHARIPFRTDQCPQDMTRERRKKEPRLKWLWNKKGAEYIYYKGKMRELRGHLKKLRQQGTVVYIQPEDDHHVNAGKLGSLVCVPPPLCACADVCVCVSCVCALDP